MITVVLVGGYFVGWLDWLEGFEAALLYPVVTAVAFTGCMLLWPLAFASAVRDRRRQRPAEPALPACPECGARLPDGEPTACAGCGLDWSVSLCEEGPQVKVPRPRFPPGHCQWCGYSTSGLPDGTCPECGRTHTPTPAQSDAVIAELEIAREGLASLFGASLLSAILAGMALLCFDAGGAPLLLSVLLLPFSAVTLSHVRNTLTGLANSSSGAERPPMAGAILWLTTIGWVVWFVAAMMLLGELRPLTATLRPGGCFV